MTYFKGTARYIQCICSEVIHQLDEYIYHEISSHYAPETCLSICTCIRIQTACGVLSTSQCRIYSGKQIYSVWASDSVVFVVNRVVKVLDNSGNEAADVVVLYECCKWLLVLANYEPG